VQDAATARLVKARESQNGFVKLCSPYRRLDFGGDIRIFGLAGTIVD
jgi:hypothetical protein